MFGKFLTSESMRPAKAVCDKRYADFFDKNGNIKIGSVFRTRISDKGLVTVVSDGGDEAAPSKRKRRGRRQGFQVDRMLRPQLEKYGMDRARAFFKSEQYVCEDHSASNPYDLLCTKRRKTLYVEVKGEVDHARNHKGKFLLSPLRGWGGLGAIAFRQLALAATCCRRFAAGGRIGVPGFVGSFGGRFAAGEDGMAGVDWWRGEVGL
ncbi:MAG: hypothetical protein KY475_14050 [Planctomycetes bacterium]|nr:hypothetical protein [Planctomycetota bacterium]